MKILDARETTTSTVWVTLAPTGKHCIAFGPDFVEIGQEMWFASASVNIDLASMQTLADSKFKVNFVKEYFEDDVRKDLEGLQINTLFENSSKSKDTNHSNRRNFEITIYQKELQFSKLYELYMKEARIGQFTFSIDLDLYRDEFRYLGNAADGVENYLLNDIRDTSNFGCKFKIKCYYLGTFFGGAQ